MKQYESKEITDLYFYRDFIDKMQKDAQYADPHLATEEMRNNNLWRAAERKNNHVFGIFQNGEIKGLFVMLILDEEKYMEMIAGLVREEEVCKVLLEMLEEKYAGYLADFVFNPENDCLRECLCERHAEFETEQQRMVLQDDERSYDTEGTHLLREEEKEQYIAMHSQDVYWTGEKVIAAPEKFRTFVTAEDGVLTGYLDITHCFDDNEPYHLYVKEACRQKGYGTKLLGAAITMNRPKAVSLLVDIDNEKALRLYQKMGFVTVKGQNSLTVHWQIPDHLSNS